MPLFQNRYRIETARLPGYDYSSPGYYFITICTKGRICYLGAIEYDAMVLSAVGRIVLHCWNEIKNHFAGIQLDEYVIMPNHLHGIIQVLPETVETPKLGVSTTTTGKSKSVSLIINQFKRACTNRIKREISPNFAWQSRFYDHIIRNNQSLYNIRKYIRHNVHNWKSDELYA